MIYLALPNDTAKIQNGGTIAKIFVVWWLPHACACAYCIAVVSDVSPSCRELLANRLVSERDRTNTSRTRGRRESSCQLPRNSMLLLLWQPAARCGNVEPSTALINTFFSLSSPFSGLSFQAISPPESAPTTAYYGEYGSNRRLLLGALCREPFHSPCSGLGCYASNPRWGLFTKTTTTTP